MVSQLRSCESTHPPHALIYSPGRSSAAAVIHNCYLFSHSESNTAGNVAVFGSVGTCSRI